MVIRFRPLLEYCICKNVNLHCLLWVRIHYSDAECLTRLVVLVFYLVSKGVAKVGHWLKLASRAKSFRLIMQRIHIRVLNLSLAFTPAVPHAVIKLILKRYLCSLYS